jgi:23S rRNA (adenine2030-N6)-methyltransferase
LTLTVSRPPSDGFGLYGSGTFILNPPYTLAATMKATLPYLVDKLGQDETAQFKVEGRAD